METKALGYKFEGRWFNSTSRNQNSLNPFNEFAASDGLFVAVRCAFNKC